MKGPLVDNLYTRPRRIRVPTSRYSPPHSSVPQLANKNNEIVRRKPIHYVYYAREENLPLPPAILNNTPPIEQLERRDVCEFLFNCFGNGALNEKKYRGESFYEYWNKYGRSDLSKCETFEKNCFICHELVGSAPNETEDGGCGSLDFSFCAIECCPKVYHKDCILSSTYHCKEKYDENNWICPRHYCYGCGEIDQERTRFCPTCPRSYCGSCMSLEKGIIEETCSSCLLTAKCMNAPEILMNLQNGQWEEDQLLSEDLGPHF